MKKLKLNYLVLSALAITTLAFMASCGGDDDKKVPDPVASFTFTQDGKTVTFTNTSTDGDTYAWNFGDGVGTSTEMSPEYTYAANGQYVAVLTVTNKSGEDDSQSVIEVINITIDGDLSDWDDIAAINIAGGGTLTTMKLENLGNNKLFVYIEGTADLTALTQINLNTDNDKTTGAFIDWVYYVAGEDILLEGDLVGAEPWGAIYPCSPCDGSTPGDWNWGDATNENIADFCVGSEIISITGGMAYELVIDLTGLGVPIATDGIGIGVVDVSLDTWGPVGAVPALYDENLNPEGTLYDYVFK